MCVHCEIPSSQKDAFYNENPELAKARDKGDVLYSQINIVGDTGCGKTSLIEAYQADKFPSITSVSRYACYKLTKINDIPAEVILYDTIGLEDYNDVQTRSLMLMFSEITILCYSVGSLESFENISSQWWPEIKASQARLRKPHILVGLKKDLRILNSSKAGENPECVMTEKGKALAKLIGAMAFIDCSSVTKEGIDKVFETAINIIYKEQRKPEKTKLWKSLCCWN